MPQSLAGHHRCSQTNDGLSEHLPRKRGFQGLNSVHLQEPGPHRPWSNPLRKAGEISSGLGLSDWDQLLVEPYQKQPRDNRNYDKHGSKTALCIHDGVQRDGVLTTRKCLQVTHTTKQVSGRKRQRSPRMVSGQGPSVSGKQQGLGWRRAPAVSPAGSPTMQELQGQTVWYFKRSDESWLLMWQSRFLVPFAAISLRLTEVRGFLALGLPVYGTSNVSGCQVFLGSWTLWNRDKSKFKEKKIFATHRTTKNCCLEYIKTKQTKTLCESTNKITYNSIEEWLLDLNCTL